MSIEITRADTQWHCTSTIELGKLECVLDPFVLAFSVETMRFHNGGYRVAKRDLDIFYV